MDKWYCRPVIFLQIIAQISIPFLMTTGDVRSSEKDITISENENILPEVLPYSSRIGTIATSLTEGDLSNTARSAVTGRASELFQQWMSDAGTARIQLDVDRNGRWDNSSGDLLFPLFDNEKSLLFIQGGLRKPSDRLTGNLGGGVRTFNHDGWMYGMNVFLDEDFTGNNRRVGIGGEAWTDYFHLSANTYTATSSWHTSRDFGGIKEEKAADGYDVRAEGWLPDFPQLGMSLTWERYRGQQVALLNRERLSNNPYSVTVGLDYTPVPLVTVNAARNFGSGGQDAHISLGLNWQFGHGWQWHISPGNLPSQRLLSGNRTELVNRNNNIVLQYRDKIMPRSYRLTLIPLTDNSPADGISLNKLQVQVTDQNGKPQTTIPVEWSVPHSVTSDVVILERTTLTNQDGIATTSLWGLKEMTVPVTAQTGAASGVRNMHFVAAPVGNLGIKVIRDNAIANDSDNNVVELLLTDAGKHPVAGQSVEWNIPDSLDLKGKPQVSDSSGKIRAEFTSHVSGEALVKASVGNQSGEVILHYTPDLSNALIKRLIVIKDGSPADGKEKNIAQVVVTDNNNNVLNGQKVSWKSDNSGIHFGDSVMTNKAGEASVEYSGILPGSSLITATLSNGKSAQASTNFIADRASAHLKDLQVTGRAVASGKDRNTATAIVVDANGNLLEKTNVSFSVSGHAALSVPSVKTDAKGRAEVSITDTVPENVMVTAKLDNGSLLRGESRFRSDPEQARLSIKSTINGSIADGRSKNQVTVTVKDQLGTPFTGQKVTITTTGQATVLQDSSITDSRGEVVADLTDTKAENVTITAMLDSGKHETTILMFAGFRVTELNAKPELVSAGNSSSLIAEVKDDSGKPVPGAGVKFSISGGIGQLSQSVVITDKDGRAETELSAASGQSVNVIAKAKRYAADTGKTKTVKFIERDRITGVGAYGSSRIFSPDERFPTTGFHGASMFIQINNRNDAANKYNWKSNQRWINFKSPGVFSMNWDDAYRMNESERRVTITAKAKDGISPDLEYRFTISKWVSKNITRYRFYPNNFTESGICKIARYKWMTIDELTSGSNREIGTFYGEWFGGQVFPVIATYPNQTTNEEQITDETEILEVDSTGSIKRTKFGRNGGRAMHNLLCAETY